MCLCRLGIHLILGGLKIIKYLDYIVRVSRQNVIQSSHIAQMSYHSVLFTRPTLPFATVVRHASRVRSTGRATSLALTYGFLIRGVLLVVRETRLAPKMSIKLGAGDSDGGEGARRPSHTITTCLVTEMCGVLHALLHALHSTSSPSRPLYSRSHDSAVRHHRTKD